MKTILRAVADVIAFTILCACLAVVVAIGAPYAHAGDVGLNLATLHNRTEVNGHKLRTATPGVYYRFDNGATAGGFSNSFGDPAGLLGLTPEARLARQWRAAATVGAVIGYRHDPFIPAVIPSVRRDIGTWGGVRLAYLPRRPGEKHGVEAVTLSLEMTQ